VIGIVASIVCFFAVSYLKNMLGYDDALDAFGIHAVGGIVGAILTGVFVNPALGGAGYVVDGWVGPTFGYDSGQIMIQVKAVLVAVIWSAVVSSVILAVLKYTIGLRVSPEVESTGLDLAEHGESAYHS
jgi:Amt family ammonium transporter